MVATPFALLTLLLAVICYSWFILGVSAAANAIGATLAVVWFVLSIRRRAEFSLAGRGRLVGFVALLSLDPLNFPPLSLRSWAPMNLIIAVFGDSVL